VNCELVIFDNLSTYDLYEFLNCEQVLFYFLLVIIVILLNYELVILKYFHIGMWCAPSLCLLGYA
jgi:hypothetical protein